MSCFFMSSILCDLISPHPKLVLVGLYLSRGPGKLNEMIVRRIQMPALLSSDEQKSYTPTFPTDSMDPMPGDAPSRGGGSESEVGSSSGMSFQSSNSGSAHRPSSSSSSSSSSSGKRRKRRSTDGLRELYALEYKKGDIPRKVRSFPVRDPRVAPNSATPHLV